MKKTLFPKIVGVLSLAICGHIYGQVQTTGAVMTPPSFPNQPTTVQGTIATSIDEYLSLHVQYPPEAIKRHLSGTEVIQFKVSTKGELGSFKVTNSVSREIDNEVIRVLETTSGKWIPGKIDGNPVPMTREISIVFKTNPSYDLVFHAKEYQAMGNKLLFIKKDPDRAIRYFNNAVRLLPKEESLLCCRCLCRYKLGDEAGAIADLARLMDINPEMRIKFMELTKEDYFAFLMDEKEQEYLSDH